MEQDDEGGLFFGVREAGVEVEEKSAHAVGFAEEDERAFVLPEQDGVGGLAFELDGFAGEQGLPVEAVHERMGFGHDAAFEPCASAGFVLDEDDGVALGERGIERVVAGDREIRRGGVVRGFRGVESVQEFLREVGEGG